MKLIDITRKIYAHLPMTPENLLLDFGENTTCARRCVSAFYKSLTTSKNNRIATLYQHWALTYSKICGYQSDSQKLNVEQLAPLYAAHAGMRDKLQSFKLIFAIHTYYAVIIKLLAVQIVNFYARGKLAHITHHHEPVTLPETIGLRSSDLQIYLRTMEEGSIFRQLGIRNFLEGDFFGWYLEDWSEELAEALSEVIRQLMSYSFVPLDTDPIGTRDLLKKLYLDLIPQELRHDLGEYYTPDWLATELLNQLHGGPPDQVPRSPEERLLDPACGSGTFLVLHIRDIRRYAHAVLLPQKKVTRQQLLKKLLANVVGYDLNPLAVISARTNYLLALGDLLTEITGEIDIPIYLADSVLTPSTGNTLYTCGKISFMTAVGEFTLPESLVQEAYIDPLTDLIEEHVKIDSAVEVFSVALCKRFSLNPARDSHDIALVEELYCQICELERQGICGLWSHMIKNAFAPLFQARFDRIAGNPPWINWEHLPDNYRHRSAWLWQQYRLFEQRGLRARLGSSKDDLSVLMLYVAADRYLRNHGRLGFVITQSIFKTQGGGEGFRRFQLGDREHLKVLQVDDYGRVQCFEGATNRTAVFILQKGEQTTYPVSYNYWQKIGRGSIPTGADHQQAMTRLRYLEWVARPIDSARKNSPWITGRRKALSHIENVTGPAAYEGRAGSCTWLNGVYWVEVIGERNDGSLIINNLFECGKIKVKNVNLTIESDFVFPLLRGRDVGRWQAVPGQQILIPQIYEDPAKGVPESSMQARYPKTYGYFKQFEAQLRNRSGFKQYFDVDEAPFYSVYNVGPYTFALHKVVWREQAAYLTAAVAGADELSKPIVPDHKLMLCPCKTAEEAHYICALLNSVPAQFIVKSYSLETSISTHIFNYVAIARYDPENETHLALAMNSQALHEATRAGDSTRVANLEAENLRLVAGYWRLDAIEVAEIKASLEELF